MKNTKEKKVKTFFHSFGFTSKKWFREFWPIKVSELSCFLPLFFIKFLASFNFTILAATKDTVIVTSRGSGAEVIPVLKGGVVILFAFLFMLLYSKLSNKLSRKSLFYIVLLPFILFFSLYGLVLYPFQDVLCFHKSANFLTQFVGEGHQHWIAVYRYWMNSLFFVSAEMWGGVVILILFWGFANQITSIKDAARFYALYTVGGHLGTILGGYITAHYAKFGVKNFNVTVMIMMLIAAFCCFLIMLTYWWVNKYVLEKSSYYLNHLSLKRFSSNKAKTKLSLKDSLIFIAKSPYLGFIAILVIGYGLSVNMVEVVWKAILKIQYPNPAQYQDFMGTLQTLIGISSLIIAIFVSGSVIRRLGWKKAALFTPVVLGITSFTFYGLYLYFPNAKGDVFTFMGLSFTPLFLLVLCGLVHNIACKSMKYCLFDPTKEMAYIPLDQESKVKGKAAVDLVGGRFGKSSASWVQLALIDCVGSGSILGVVHYLVPIVFLALICWVFAVKMLGKYFNVARGQFLIEDEVGDTINKQNLAI